MATNEDVIRQIIIAVVVALLVGGTSPWWWHEFFPKNDINFSSTLSTPSQISNQTVSSTSLTPSEIPNRAPTIRNIEINPKVQVTVGESILVTVDATDPDNDEILYKFLIRGPKDEEFEPRTGWISNNELTWTPTEDQVGNNEIKACVEDIHSSDPSKGDDCIVKAYRITQNAAFWNEKGLASYYHQSYDEAISAFDKSIEIDPQYAQAWFNKGIALGEQGKYYEAIGSFDEAIRINSQYLDAMDAKGVAYQHLGEYDEAIQYYEKVIELNPRYAYAWNDKGVALVLKGEYFDAIDCFDKAIEINPDYANAWHNKGVALRRLNRYLDSSAAENEASKLGYIESSLEFYIG